MNRAALIEHIRAERSGSSLPLMVGVSGFGGSGKSTLDRVLVEAIPGAVRMRGDDFLDPVRSHERSTDWDGVERQRLVSEVLTPVRLRQPGHFHRFDWVNGTLGEAEPLPETDVLMVDLIGLFHPEALPSIDITVWCDVDLDTAAERGIARDRQLGRDHETLWREVWTPNERDIAMRYAPRSRADVLYEEPRETITGRAADGA